MWLFQKERTFRWARQFNFFFSPTDWFRSSWGVSVKNSDDNEIDDKKHSKQSRQLIFLAEAFPTNFRICDTKNVPPWTRAGLGSRAAALVEVNRVWLKVAGCPSLVVRTSQLLSAVSKAEGEELIHVFRWLDQSSFLIRSCWRRR